MKWKNFMMQLLVHCLNANVSIYIINEVYWIINYILNVSFTMNSNTGVDEDIVGTQFPVEVNHERITSNFTAGSSVPGYGIPA